ncbi:short-chain dehydrogenase, partial [Actinomadura adrarensis]
AAGALPTLYAAVHPDAEQGACYGPRIIQWRGSPTKVVTPPRAANKDLATRLWEVSETLTGVRYETPAEG